MHSQQYTDGPRVHGDHPRTQRRAVALLSAGHFCADISQGALPALLPFLIATRGLKFAQAGGLVFAMSVGSSVIQPAFGYFADRLAKPWLMSLGLFLAGVGMSMVGIAPTYWTIVLAAAVSGFGTAAFHPEAARLTNVVAKQNKATAMSYFSFGGNAGFAFGPVLAAGAYFACGLKGTLALAMPPVVMAVVLMSYLALFTSSPSQQETQSKASEQTMQPDSWHSLVVTLRSIIFYGISTFLPLFYIHVLRQHPAFGSSMLTVFFGVGALGSLIGGSLADRFGNRKIIKYGFVGLFPVLLMWMYATTASWAAIVELPLAILYYAPFSAIVVLGQQYLPNRVGFASGVTLGLAVSIGGVVAPLLGRWADIHGIRSALFLVAILPVICAVIAYALPSPMRKREA